MIDHESRYSSAHIKIPDFIPGEPEALTPTFGSRFEETWATSQRSKYKMPPMVPVAMIPKIRAIIMHPSGTPWRTYSTVNGTWSARPHLNSTCGHRISKRHRAPSVVDVAASTPCAERSSDIFIWSKPKRVRWCYRQLSHTRMHSLLKHSSWTPQSFLMPIQVLLAYRRSVNLFPPYGYVKRSDVWCKRSRPRLPVSADGTWAASVAPNGRSNSTTEYLITTAVSALRCVASSWFYKWFW